jgi:hypothetical protein
MQHSFLSSFTLTMLGTLAFAVSIYIQIYILLHTRLIVGVNFNAVLFSLLFSGCFPLLLLPVAMAGHGQGYCYALMHVLRCLSAASALQVSTHQLVFLCIHRSWRR